MIGRVFIVCVVMVVVSARHNLFDPENPIASESASVNLVENTKRDADGTDYLLTISVHGKRFDARLKRSDDTDFPVFNDGVAKREDAEKDWGIYTSDEVDGHFLVAKRSAGLTIEGYLRDAGEAYLIQPANEAGDHVIHTIDKYSDDSESDPPVAVEKRDESSESSADSPVIHVVEKRSSSESDPPVAVEKRDESSDSSDPPVAVEKRDATSYVVEIYAVIDKEAVKFVDNSKMANTDTDKTIRQFYAMHLAGNSIPDHTKWESYQGSTKLIESGKGLYGFSDWIHKQSNLPKYDYTVVYTGYDLTSDGKTSTAGMAYIGRMCGYNSVGICEFSFTTGAIRTAAHELGHGLGARHTWISGCPDDYTIMSYNGYKKEKEDQWWTFSRCAAKDIREHLNKDSRSKCLKETSSPAVNSNAEFVGNTMTVDEQCELGSKDTLGFARHKGLDNICGSFRCMTVFNMKTGGMRWSLNNALPGTQCGDKKWCEGGKCVYNAKAKRMPDPTCPFGDSPKICANIKGPRDCMGYLGVVREKYCCKKCKVDPKNIQVVSAHEQCDLKYKKGLGASTRQTNLNNICKVIACYVRFSPNGGYSYNWLKPMDGTPCGDKKLCIGGECVSNARAPAVKKAKCPFGDNPYVCNTALKCDSWRRPHYCCSPCKVDLSSLKLENAHDQCNKKFGGNLGAFTGKTDLSDMCNWIACYTKFDTSSGVAYGWNWMKPKNGTPCGHKKLCIGGKCVANDKGPVLTKPECPMGPNPNVCRQLTSCRSRLTKCCSDC